MPLTEAAAHRARVWAIYAGLEETECRAGTPPFWAAAVRGGRLATAETAPRQRVEQVEDPPAGMAAMDPIMVFPTVAAAAAVALAPQVAPA